MTGALVLMASGLLVLVVGHLPLLRMSRPDRDPRAAIVAWILAVAGAVGSIAIGVAMLVLPDHAGLLGLLSKAGNCLVHLGHEGAPSYEETAGLLSLLVLGTATVRVAIVTVRMERARRSKREHHRFLVALLSIDRNTDDDVVWLENDGLMAYSLSGRPGLVVASHAVRERLTPDATAATLEHERAHLQGHHHLLLAVAGNLGAALPFVPLLRQASLTLRALVEYAADTAAVERCGHQAVQSALLAFVGSPVPRHGLAMAGETIAHRLDRLETTRRNSPRRRAFSCGIAGAAAVLAPIAVTAATFLGIACPVA